MDNEMESNKRDHKVEITDIAISKVPYVRYGRFRKNIMRHCIKSQ